MSFGFGVAAALAAPFVMTIGFIVWDNCWKGSAFSLNLFKCNLASIGFLILSLTTRSGDRFPSPIFTRTSVGYLMLSATMGILIGDWMWLEGLRLLGARKVIVIDSCKPFLAALFGWVILGEALRPVAFGGMALTVTGVLIVSLEREKELEEEPDDSEPEAEEASNENKDEDTDAETTNGVVQSTLSVEDHGEESARSDEEMMENSTSTDVERDSKTENNNKERKKMARNIGSRRKMLTPALSRRGYGMAFLNVVLDTYGSVLTKEHGVGMTTWEINLIRFGFSGLCMLALSLALHCRYWLMTHGHAQESSDTDSPITNQEGVNVKKKDEHWYSLPRSMTRKTWLKVIMGVGLVTFLTPALSNYALFQIALALALTLGSVGPLYALPLTWLLQHDRPTIRAIVGGALAVAGIVILSLLGKQQ